MIGLQDYRDRYNVVRFERDKRGVLVAQLHTNGGPLEWGHTGGAHEELAEAFGFVARDTDNRVVIITGTGDRFCGPRASSATFPRSSVKEWEVIQSHAFQLAWNLVSIDVPVISCVNGPAWRHAEIPLLADVVLAADTATFQDTAHFVNGTVPGDGLQVLMPLLLGFNRGRYYLLTGQEIDAREAHHLGLVAEVMPAGQLLARAHELAGTFLEHDELVLRYTRRAFMQPLKEALLRAVPFGSALEGLAVVHESIVFSQAAGGSTA